MCLFSGNMVEWCLPQDIDLEGVEFKSMASGSHKIQSDFMWVFLSWVASSFSWLYIYLTILNSHRARKTPPMKLNSRTALLLTCAALSQILFRYTQYCIQYQLAVWDLLCDSCGCGGQPASHGCAVLMLIGQIMLHCKCMSAETYGEGEKMAEVK